MDLTFADIAALKTVSRRPRIAWAVSVAVVPIILVAELWRLLHSADPLPMPEVLRALTSALTCGFLCWFVIYLPRTAGCADRRETLR